VNTKPVSLAVQSRLGQKLKLEAVEGCVCCVTVEELGPKCSLRFRHPTPAELQVGPSCSVRVKRCPYMLCLQFSHERTTFSVTRVAG